MGVGYVDVDVVFFDLVGISVCIICNGFVVFKVRNCFVSFGICSVIDIKSQVVQVVLGCCVCVECFQYDVCDFLIGCDVVVDNCCGVCGIEKIWFGDFDVYGSEIVLVEGNIGFDDIVQGVDDGGVGDGFGGIDIVMDFVVGFCKVKDC